MFVNYTPSFPEPRIIRKLSGHFCSTTLPLKSLNSRLLFFPSQLLACSRSFITSIYTVSASLQTYSTTSEAHSLLISPFLDVSQGTSFENSRRSESQVSTVQSNDFEKIFQKIEDLDKNDRTVVNVTADTDF